MVAVLLQAAATAVSPVDGVPVGWVAALGAASAAALAAMFRAWMADRAADRAALERERVAHLETLRSVLPLATSATAQAARVEDLLARLAGRRHT